MNLRDCPSELFQEILQYAVEVRTLKRALRLKLVNKWNLPPTSPERLRDEAVIREIATQLYQELGVEDADTTQCQHYLHALCKNYTSTALQLRSAAWRMDRRRNTEAQDTKIHLLAAAVITNKASLVAKLLAESDGAIQASSIFGSPANLAAYHGNNKILRLLMPSKSEEDLRCKIFEALRGAAIGGSLETWELILDPQWGRIELYQENVNSQLPQLPLGADSYLRALMSGLSSPNKNIFARSLELLAPYRGDIAPDGWLFTSNRLIDAISQSYFDLVVYLFDQGVPIEAPMGKPTNSVPSAKLPVTDTTTSSNSSSIEAQPLTQTAQAADLYSTQQHMAIFPSCAYCLITALIHLFQPIKMVMTLSKESILAPLSTFTRMPHRGFGYTTSDFIPERLKTDLEDEVARDRLSAEEWELLAVIKKFLEALKQTTKSLESTNITLDRVFHRIYFVLCYFGNGKRQYINNLQLKQMFNSGWDKIAKYYKFSDESPVYAAALILNPSRKW
ncbi:hypothetical protein G7Y89_g4889 [Cudoniella acicularis]|uniref:Uncharacterized protein n=1 Tax=Cudoniella acicularis TaxID=354080 RepID=A0A8H4RRM5_9HELO|nr:hypothetical protein G7Y89_g4889 [Cudoniella acicularis]